MVARRVHHGSLDVLIAEAGDTPGPLSFVSAPVPFEFEAELAKEIDRLFEVVNDDADVVQSFERDVPNPRDVV